MPSVRFYIPFVVLSALTSTAFAQGLSGRVEVIDGDTISMEAVEPRFRLYGIDAPEGRQTCRDAQDLRYLCGTRAAEALASIIGGNGRVTCTEMGRDRYVRIVAVCTLRGVDVGRELVRRGWAVEYTRYSDGRYAGTEEAARVGRRGMWVGTFTAPWDHRRGINTPYRSSISQPLFAFASGSFNVAQRRSCRAVSTCREAVEMWCGGYTGADRDGNGIPCENIGHSRAQVDQLRREAGC